MPLLSVIIPVFNEAKTINNILEKINFLNIDKEMVVVDDGSTDGTDRILRNINYENLKIVYHTTNRGKGAAFLTGLANSSGEFVVIQDADLEYDPNEYSKLLEVIRSGVADIVLGARFTKGYHGLFLHRLGNRTLTGLFNLLFNSHLNDYLTCYKLTRRSTFNLLNLKAKGFDIELEIVCKALKNKLKIREVPISYFPRSYKEGKKIRLKDAFWAIFYMIKFRLGG